MRIHTKKKILMILLICGVCLCSCTKKQSFEISEEVQTVLEKYGVTKSHITSLCDYTNLSKTVAVPDMDDAEFEKAFEEDIAEFEPLTDQFVQEAFGFQTVEEFKEDERKNFLEHLKIMAIFEARGEVMNYLIEHSEFVLDEVEVAEYSKSKIYAYENEGIMYGYDDLETYVQEGMNLTMDQFMENCVQESEYEMKKYLVIGAITQKEHMEVERSDDSYATYQKVENQFYSLFLKADDDF